MALQETINLYPKILNTLDTIIKKYEPALPKGIIKKKSFEAMVAAQEKILEQEAAANAVTLPPTTPAATMYAVKKPADVEEQKIEVEPKTAVTTLEVYPHHEDHLLLFGETHEDEIYEYEIDEDEISTAHHQEEASYSPKIESEEHKKLVLAKLKAMRYNITEEQKSIVRKTDASQRVLETDCQYLFPIPNLTVSSFSKDLQELDELVGQIPIMGSRKNVKPYVMDCLRLIHILSNYKKELMPQLSKPLKEELMSELSQPLPMPAYRASISRRSRGTTASAASVKCKNLLSNCSIS